MTLSIRCRLNIKRRQEMAPFATDIMDAAFKASQELLEEHAAKDATYAKIYTAWKKTRQIAFVGLKPRKQPMPDISLGTIHFPSQSRRISSRCSSEEGSFWMLVLYHQAQKARVMFGRFVPL